MTKRFYLLIICLIICYPTWSNASKDIDGARKFINEFILSEFRGVPSFRVDNALYSKERELYIKKKYIQNRNYLDHAYAITTHKSQGASYNNDIYCAKADNVDQKQFYVAASRSRHDFEIFVDDKERFFENVKIEQQKSSTLDYIQDNKREQKLESEIQIDAKESRNEIKSSVQQEQSLEQEKPRFREMEMEL